MKAPPSASTSGLGSWLGSRPTSLISVRTLSQDALEFRLFGQLGKPVPDSIVESWAQHKRKSEFLCNVAIAPVDD